MMDIFTGVRHQLRHGKPLVEQVVMLHRHQVKNELTSFEFKNILAARSPPNIKESPARFIPAPKPINALDVDQAIDINKPIRGAFVRREVVGEIFIQNQSGRNN